MRAIVLGSAAGGGSPQWNCRCAVCALGWTGDPRVRRRTQSSVAISTDGASWVLLNCSPDIREQIAATPALHPRGPGRGSPIAGVVVTNADIDHSGGLLTLREGTPLVIFATEAVMEALRGNRMFSALAEGTVSWQAIAPEEHFEPLPGVSVSPFAVPGKLPLYLEADQAAAAAGETVCIGLAVRHQGGGELLYVPGTAAVDDGLRGRAARADVLLFDGTLFVDDEMIAAGLGKKTGRRMGHLPISGDGGSLHAFDGGPARRIYVHVNNTNPILVEGSPERRRVEAAGWEVAEDGMEIRL